MTGADIFTEEILFPVRGALRRRAPSTADSNRDKGGGGGVFPLQDVLGRPPRPRFNPFGSGGDADFVDPPTPELNGGQVCAPLPQ